MFTREELEVISFFEKALLESDWTKTKTNTADDVLFDAYELERYGYRLLAHFEKGKMGLFLYIVGFYTSTGEHFADIAPLAISVGSYLKSTVPVPKAMSIINQCRDEFAKAFGAKKKV